MSRIQELSEDEAQKALMVQLSEEGEHWETDSAASGVSSDDDFDPDDETLGERVAALKDIIAPAQRSVLRNSMRSVQSWAQTLLLFGGKTGYVVAASALLLGVPLALSIVDEQQLLVMEKEMKMQQGANEVLAPGASNQYSRQV